MKRKFFLGVLIVNFFLAGSSNVQAAYWQDVLNTIKGFTFQSTKTTIPTSDARRTTPINTSFSPLGTNFNNADVQIMALQPTDGATSFGLQDSIIITLNKAVGRTKMAHALTLSTIGKWTPVNLVAVNETSRGPATYIYQVTEPMISDTTYKATLSNIVDANMTTPTTFIVQMDGVNQRSGTPTNTATVDPTQQIKQQNALHEYTWAFHTTKAPWVKEVIPPKATKNFVIKFSADMNFESLKNAIILNRQPSTQNSAPFRPASVEPFLGRNNEALVETGDLDYGQSYQVTLTKEASDIQGNHFPLEFNANFSTPPDPSNPTNPSSYTGYLGWKSEPINLKSVGGQECINNNPSQACFSGPNSGGGKTTLMCPKNYVMTGFGLSSAKREGSDFYYVRTFDIFCNGVYVNNDPNGSYASTSMRAWPTQYAGTPPSTGSHWEGIFYVPNSPAFGNKLEPYCGGQGIVTSISGEVGIAQADDANRLISFGVHCSILDPQGSPYMGATRDDLGSSWSFGDKPMTQAFSIKAPPGKAIVGMDVYSGTDIDGVDAVWTVDLSPLEGSLN